MKKTTVKTPIKDLGKHETIEHYNAVLLEKISSDVKQVIEGAEATRDTLRKEMREFRKEVNERFSMVDFVLGKHSEDINGLKGDVQELKGDVQILKDDVQELRGEMQETRKCLSDKIDKVGEGVEANEARLDHHIAHHT